MSETLRLERTKVDSNNDGFVDFTEFKAYLEPRTLAALKDFTSRPDSGITLIIYRRGKADDAASPKEEAGAARPKWEYRILTREEIHKLGTNDLKAGLTKLGEEGWELITLEPEVKAEVGRTGQSAMFYFKRPK